MSSTTSCARSRARACCWSSTGPSTQRVGGMSAFTALRVAPLSQERAADLLKSLLGEHPGLAPLSRRLLARTEGNPLFLEESVRALAEQGARSAPGAYRLAQPLDTIRIPAMVQDVLASAPRPAAAARRRWSGGVRARQGSLRRGAEARRRPARRRSSRRRSPDRKRRSSSSARSFPTCSTPSSTRSRTKSSIQPAAPAPRRLHTAIVEAMLEEVSRRSARPALSRSSPTTRKFLHGTSSGSRRSATCAGPPRAAYERSACRTAPVAYLGRAIRALARLAGHARHGEARDRPALRAKGARCSPSARSIACSPRCAARDARRRLRRCSKRRRASAAQLAELPVAHRPMPIATPAEAGEGPRVRRPRRQRGPQFTTRFYLLARRAIPMGDYRHRTVELLRGGERDLRSDQDLAGHGASAWPACLRCFPAPGSPGRGPSSASLPPPGEALPSAEPRSRAHFRAPCLSVLAARFASAIGRKLTRGEPRTGGGDPLVLEPGACHRPAPSALAASMDSAAFATPARHRARSPEPRAAPAQSALLSSLRCPRRRPTR